MKATRLLLVAALATGLAAACGDDDDTASADTTATSAPGAGAGGDTVRVTAVDYGFDGLPAAVDAGTRLELTNESDTEIHELVAVRLADDDQRTSEELAALPPGELGAIFATGPTAVLVAPPSGAPQIPAVGDGTLLEAGRYLVICTIPMGADPAEFLAAAAESDGPPQVAGGPPHFTAGMHTVLVVE